MKRLLLILLALAAVLVVAVAARVLFYRQVDDHERVEGKRAYLDRIAASPPARRPDLVLIVFDDLGVGDVSGYGDGPLRTPRLDSLAADGLKFDNAYSASPYCTAARAGLLTGRLAVRSGLDHVLQPSDTLWNALLRLGGLNLRLPAEELTLPELMAAAGYATGMFGKWHLGEESPSLPNDRGFERYFGLLHSNDQGEPRLWRDRRVEEPHPVDQSTLTRRYTREAVAFVEAAGERPLFLYLAHTFPHIPLHAAPDRRGRSPAGLYGDVVEELDWSVGRVLEALERTGRAAGTLVIATSDNGPWFQGAAAGLRGRKLDVFEGGLRVPLLMRWPERIAGGAVSREVVSGLDLLPTVLDLLGLPAPEDRVLDGASLVPLLEEPGRPPRARPFFYYQLGTARAVRRGRFKYHARHGVFYGNPMDWPWGPMKRRGPWLFDLEADPAEAYDLSARRPAQAARLRRLLEAHQRRVAANPPGWR